MICLIFIFACFGPIHASVPAASQSCSIQVCSFLWTVINRALFPPDATINEVLLEQMLIHFSCKISTMLTEESSWPTSDLSNIIKAMRRLASQTQPPVRIRNSWSNILNAFCHIFHNEKLYFHDLQMAGLPIHSHSFPPRIHKSFGFAELLQELYDELNVMEVFSRMVIKYIPHNVSHIANIRKIITQRAELFGVVLVMSMETFCNDEVERSFIMQVADQAANISSLITCDLISAMHHVRPVRRVKKKQKINAEKTYRTTVRIDWEHKVGVEQSGPFVVSEWPFEFIAAQMDTASRLLCIDGATMHRMRLSSCGSIVERLDLLPPDSVCKFGALLPSVALTLTFGTADVLLPSISVHFLKHSMSHAHVPVSSSPVLDGFTVAWSPTTSVSTYFDKGRLFCNLPLYLYDMAERFCLLNRILFVTSIWFMNTNILLHVSNILAFYDRLNTDMEPARCAQLELPHFTLYIDIQDLCKSYVHLKMGIKEHMFIQCLIESINGMLGLLVCLAAENLIFTIPEYDAQSSSPLQCISREWLAMRWH